MSLPLGPFRGSSTLLSGLVTKIPWKLNRTRKANQRQRLASVKEVIEVLRATMPIKALNSPEAKVPTTPTEMYFKARPVDPYNKTGLKGIHKIPHFTKMTPSFEDRHKK